MRHAIAVRGALIAALAACSTTSEPIPRVPEGDSGSSSRDGAAPPDPTPREWRASVGDDGVFAQTFDEKTWATRRVADRALYAVTCVGNLRGWVAGARGYVAHTLDGGATWTQDDAHFAGDLRAIRYGSATLGVVAGDDGALAVSRDGGATYTTVSTGVHVALRGAAVAFDAGVMVVVGDGATLLRSRDLGRVWATVPVPGAGDFRAVASDPGAHLILAADAAGNVWRSDDGARTFARERDFAAPSALEAVVLTYDGRDALAVGAKGFAARRDARGTWSTLATGSREDLHAALIAEGGARLYVAGDSGELRTSANGGETWEHVPLETRAALRGLEDL